MRQVQLLQEMVEQVQQIVLQDHQQLMLVEVEGQCVRLNQFFLLILQEQQEQEVLVEVVEEVKDLDQRVQLMLQELLIQEVVVEV